MNDFSQKLLRNRGKENFFWAGGGGRGLISAEQNSEKNEPKID